MMKRYYERAGVINYAEHINYEERKTKREMYMI
jgi:hypothetical protein